MFRKSVAEQNRCNFNFRTA